MDWRCRRSRRRLSLTAAAALVLAAGRFFFLDEVVKLSRGTRRIKVHDACLAIIVE